MLVNFDGLQFEGSPEVRSVAALPSGHYIINKTSPCDYVWQSSTGTHGELSSELTYEDAVEACNSHYRNRLLELGIITCT